MLKPRGEKDAIQVVKNQPLGASCRADNDPDLLRAESIFPDGLDGFPAGQEDKIMRHGNTPGIRILKFQEAIGALSRVQDLLR